MTIMDGLLLLLIGYINGFDGSFLFSNIGEG